MKRSDGAGLTSPTDASKKNALTHRGSLIMLLHHDTLPQGGYMEDDSRRGSYGSHWEYTHYQVSVLHRSFEQIMFAS